MITIMDEVLNKNLVFLTTNLSNIVEVLLYLIEKKIVSQYESEAIRNNPTSLEKNEKLISLMKKKDGSTLPQFLGILRKTGNGHLADKLEETIKEINLVQNMQRINLQNEPLNTSKDSEATDAPSPEIGENISDTIKNFEIMDNLGEGTYGTVLLGKKTENSIESLYALKVLKSKYKEIDREVKSLKMLGEHDNIVKLVNSWMEKRDDLPITIKMLIPKTIDEVWIIQMEYCEGNDLENWLKLKPTEKTVTDAQNIILQICNGVIHLHSIKRGNGLEILHRDLKPENILFFKKYEIGQVHVKIGDFGLCRKSIQSSRTAPVKKTTRLGTPFYASPEQQERGRSEYTTKTDIYSMGLIFIEVLTSTISALNFSIQEDIREKIYQDLYLEQFKKEHNFLENLVNENPGSRPNAEQIYTHFQELWNKKIRHVIVVGNDLEIPDIKLTLN